MEQVVFMIDLPEGMRGDQINSLVANLAAQCEAYDEAEDRNERYPTVPYRVIVR